MSRAYRYTLIAGFVGFMLLCTTGIALAEDSGNETVSTSEKSQTKTADNNPTIQRKSNHNFNYDMHISSREYENPLQESFHNGISGGLLGLGCGIAFVLVNSAIGGKTGQGEGRVIGGLTGIGFLGGAVYGFVRATSLNSELREERSKIYEKYGSIPPSHKPEWSPTLFRGSSGNLGVGLSLALTLGH